MTKADNSSNVRRARNGVPLLPVSKPQAVITLETVKALRDELVVSHADKTEMHAPLDRTPNHGESPLSRPTKRQKGHLNRPGFP